MLNIKKLYMMLKLRLSILYDLTTNSNFYLHKLSWWVIFITEVESVYCAVAAVWDTQLLAFLRQVGSALVFGLGTNTFIQLRLETTSRGVQGRKKGRSPTEEDEEQAWSEFISSS
jgi:hypothetical protein